MNSSKKKLYKKDLETLGTFTYIDQCIVRDPLLKTWDIKQDKEYTINIELNKQLEQRYGTFIQVGYIAPLYIRWINKFVEYGAFADKDIEKGSMICEYTGIIEREEPFNEDNLYLWDYPTIIYEKQEGKKYRKKITFCVNAEMYGNVGRFINHSQKRYQNVGIQMIPYNNLWHVVYIAIKNIPKDAQLLTHYGLSYWRDRKIVPITLKA